MKSLLKIAAASLTVAALAALSTPAFAAPAHVEVRFSNGYGQQQAYAPPSVFLASQAPAYRYHDENGWRRQQWRAHEWRQRERRAHYWRERERQEQHGRAHGGHDDHRDRDRRGNWR